MANKPIRFTCLTVEASRVQFSHEHLQPYDGVDDDDKEHQERDMCQRDHCHQDGVQHDLEACSWCKKPF